MQTLIEGKEIREYVCEWCLQLVSKKHIVYDPDTGMQICDACYATWEEVLDGKRTTKG